MRITKLCAATALVLIGAFPIELQRKTGAIEGFVVDQWGPVAAASLTARNLISGTTVHGKSDSQGHYRLDGLHAGTYSIWVEAVGHDSIWVMRVQVERGLDAQQDMFIRKRFGGVSSLDRRVGPPCRQCYSPAHLNLTNDRRQG